MFQQYQPSKTKLTPAERRELMANVGHLLNRLRSVAEEAGDPLCPAEENAFWQFIGTLPFDDQTSIIS